jgi:site-specific DNA-methyltransferase (adenine-specific)
MKPYYKDDYAEIWHADCRDILPSLANESVDLVFTDPPYGHNNNNNGDLIHNWEAALGIRKNKPEDARPIANDGEEEASRLVKFVFSESRRVLKPGCCCCCCCGGGGGPDPQFARWSLWLDELLGFKQMIVWDKGGLGMGWHYRRNYETILVGEKPGAACRWFGGSSVGNVVRISGLKPTADDHPTPKPIELPMKFIGWHTQPHELVVDPLMGGGSTAEAAKLMGRRFVGCDVDERWLGIAAKRLAQEVLAFK